MSELSVGQLKGLLVNSNIINVPSGHSLYSPGHIIQVQSATKTNAMSNTSTSWQDIPGMSISITPKFSSSKILVSFNIGIANASSSWGFLQLWRNSTAIATTTLSTNATFVSNLASAAASEMVPVAVSYLDSPATSASVTYKLTVRNDNASTTTWVGSRTGGDIGMVSNITVMEVAA